MKRVFKILRDIDEEVVDSLEDAYYPLLLNSDPSKAAVSLTVEDALKAHEALTYIYNNPDDKKYKLLRDAINYNSFNYEWFYIFYINIKDKYKEFIKIESAFPELPKVKNTLYAEIKTFLPFFILPYKDKYKLYTEQFVKEHFMTYLKDKKGVLEEVTSYPSIEKLNRALYIKEEYEAEDFLNGFPSWYQLPVKVYEKYNPSLNKRVRICYEHNEFRYFIAGASDNWEEVYEVPLEIDAVIHTLLFNF